MSPQDELVEGIREAMDPGGFIAAEGERLKFAAELAKAEKLRERREQIATAALTGMLVESYDNSSGLLWSYEDAALHAVKYADALISELDKQEVRSED